MKGTASLVLIIAFLFGSTAAPQATIVKREVAIIGILCKEEDGSPLSDGFAGVTGAEDLYHDRTNTDGIYCVYVPKQIRDFTLSYKAGTYWGKFSRRQKSDRDTVKMDRACLKKKKPNEVEQLGKIDKLIDTEYRMYVSSASPNLRKLLRDELHEYLGAIEIPPPTDTAMSSDERKLRLGAKALLENILFKMRSGHER